MSKILGRTEGMELGRAVGRLELLGVQVRRFRDKGMDDATIADLHDGSEEMLLTL